MQSSLAYPAYMLQRKQSSTHGTAFLKTQRSQSDSTAPIVLQTTFQLQLGSIKHYHIGTCVTCIAVVECGQLIADLLDCDVTIHVRPQYQLAMDDPPNHTRYVVIIPI